MTLTAVAARADSTSTTITLTALTPATVSADAVVRVEITVTLASPGRVYADARTGEGACPATYAEDLSSGGRALLIESPLTTGQFALQTDVSYAAAGTYSVCAWAAASPSDPASVPASPLAFTVVAPTIVATRTTARFPARVNRMLHAYASIVAVGGKGAGGSCVLQQLRRVWVEIAKSRVVAGRCVVAFRFLSPGGKRVRIAYLPRDVTFAASASRSALVMMNRP